MTDASLLNTANADYLEALYQDFLSNPSQVPAQWRDFFEKLDSDTVKFSENVNSTTQTE